MSQSCDSPAFSQLGACVGLWRNQLTLRTTGKGTQKVNLNILTTSHQVAETFDYVPTRGDNGVKYGVWYGGTAPLRAGNNGRYIGDVARLDGLPGWRASADSGDAADCRWITGFRTRREATLCLVGMYQQRVRPARHWRDHVPVADVE